MIISILFYFNYIVAKFLKFVIKKLIGYDLWTYIDDSIRICPNNSVYDINTNTYILDYEYFNISDTIYYHKKFLNPTLEYIYYFDLFHLTKNREDDEHELYGLMSTYIIPLQYKYYILEHYWPSDEKGSIIAPNFYNFKDLESEFKFIYEDYKSLWPKYEKYMNTKDLFYNENLYDSNMNQFYIYKFNIRQFLKTSVGYWYMLQNKKYFWKKETRTFDLIEPSQELCLKKHFTWFLLKCKYDEAKFKYDVFCRLPPYDFFDAKYYSIFLSSDYNLINLELKWSHFIENRDEYFNDFINSENLINYYFNVHFFSSYYKMRFTDCEYDYDLPSEPFDFFFFVFVERGLLMLSYLIFFYYFFFSLFFFFVCYYCWFSHIYSFNFDLYIEAIRMLTRSKYYHYDYNDYVTLIFNYNKTTINDFFFNQNFKI